MKNKKYRFPLLAAVLFLITASVFYQVSRSDTDLELKVYTCADSKNPIPPHLELLEDNRFLFTFSSLSSYLGYGTYQINGDTLVLSTDDGKYQYAFQIHKNTLIFDAEHSSEEIWFGDFGDGAVFH